MTLRISCTWKESVEPYANGDDDNGNDDDDDNDDVMFGRNPKTNEWFRVEKQNLLPTHATPAEHQQLSAAAAIVEKVCTN